MVLASQPYVVNKPPEPPKIATSIIPPSPSKCRDILYQRSMELEKGQQQPDLGNPVDRLVIMNRFFTQCADATVQLKVLDIVAEIMKPIPKLVSEPTPECLKPQPVIMKKTKKYVRKTSRKRCGKMLATGYHCRKYANIGSKRCCFHKHLEVQDDDNTETDSDYSDTGLLSDIEVEETGPVGDAIASTDPLLSV